MNTKDEADKFSEEDRSLLATLNNELEILHLIHHRNKNQHKTLVWWRHLDILRRYINKLVAALGTERALKVAHYIHKRGILEKAFREFNGIIALGQFITLGLTLVAVVLKIWTHLERFREQRTKMEGRGIVDRKTRGSSFPNLNYVEIGESADDIGEEINMEELKSAEASKGEDKKKSLKISDDKKSNRTMEKIAKNAEIIERSTGDSKNESYDSKKAIKPQLKRKKQTMDDIFGTKKKKKLKKKNAMDDIFG